MMVVAVGCMSAEDTPTLFALGCEPVEVMRFRVRHSCEPIVGLELGLRGHSVVRHDGRGKEFQRGYQAENWSIKVVAAASTFFMA